MLRKKNKIYVIPVVVFIFNICLTIIVAYFVYKNTEKIDKQQLEISATEIKGKIQSRLNLYIQFAQNSSSFVMASDTITRADWHNFVTISKVGTILKGFQGVAYVNKLPVQQLQQHEQHFQKEFSPQYHVFPEETSKELTPIIYIEPFIDRNLKAIGYNISSNANMRTALEASRDINSPVLTNKVTLIQEGVAGEQPGIVIYSPFYDKNLPIETVHEKRNAIRGWTAISFRMYDFMDGIMSSYNSTEESPVSLTIFDGEAIDSINVLYHSIASVKNKDTAANDMNALHIPIHLNGKIWTLSFFQKEFTWLGSFSFIAFIIGFVISSLISFLIFSLYSTAKVAKKIADKLTKDISKQNKELVVAKETAETSENQLKLISNNIVNGMIYQVVTLDNNHRKFTYLSDAVEQMYGCSVEEAKEDATLIYGKIYEEDLEEFKKKEELAYKEMSVFKSEVRMVNPDGTLRWSLFVSNPRQMKGVVCWDGIEFDITAQKKIEKELIVAKAKAEESNRLKTAFLNNMSHEIRTPMNGIIGFTDFLLSPNLTDEKKAIYINIIKSSSFQLLHVIDDIIDISRLGTNQVSVIESEFCLNELLLELFSIFDIKAKENKIPLYLKNNLKDVESTILSDRFKLHKIISNLLENALKFTNEGFIEFGYTITAEKALEIYVKDTGLGIPEDTHELIFERFSQVEKNFSKKMGGLGLGLSIVKENVDLLGGSIRLKSSPGEGATFYITIPYKKCNVITEEIEIAEEVKHKYTLLIAEDEEVNYLYLETLIHDVLNLDCYILHAKNGKEAIAYCNSHTDIDLVLMDLKMPVMSGFEAVKIIKEKYPLLTIIAQSAYSTQDDIAHALSLGFDDFITKPIEVESFEKLIHTYLILKED